MALRSAIAGLEALRRPCSVIFTSDSQYLVRGMTEWVDGWQARKQGAFRRRRRRKVRIGMDAQTGEVRGIELKARGRLTGWHNAPRMRGWFGHGRRRQ